MVLQLLVEVAFASNDNSIITIEYHVASTGYLSRCVYVHVT